MKIVTSESDKTLDITLHNFIVKKLSKNAKKMLDLIHENPGISPSSIQRKFRFESRHTLLKYMKQLLVNELIEVKKSETDKRQKQSKLTSKGHLIRKLIIKQDMKECLSCFLENCEKLYLTKNQGYSNSYRWMKFKQAGYSDNIIKALEDQVFAYISEKLNSDY
ncbi:MAG: winged helix DNA-binding protein [Candidatus Hodarchaeota archaeon]